MSIYKNNIFLLTLTIVVCIMFTTIQCKSIYDIKKSYVTQLTNFNFDNQILKIRQNTNQVSIVHFYKQSDKKSKDFVSAFDQWVNQYRGVFKVGSVDCDQYDKICQKQNVKQFPTFKIYPPNPIPILDYQGDLDVSKIQKAAAKYLHSNIIQITNANLKTFLGQNPSVPKVLLFTDKKGIPMIYKGLSVAFEKKLNFGIVRSSDEIVVDNYQVKKFPTVIVVKTGQKKPHFYKGKEFNFNDIFQFLNVFSQVFVPGGGSSLDSSATKQWMTEIFPQMHSKSAKDICLGTDGYLCVIYVTKETPSKDIKSLFEQLNVKFDVKMDRGAKFKFMWLNAEIQKAWSSIFGYQDGKDRVVVLNPGKRKRYTVHQGPLQKEYIAQTLDGIIGGDAKFNRLSELPSFELRAS